jgi:MinD-like ATPase involved in chromosome partitioning or flagellar assembly
VTVVGALLAIGDLDLEAAVLSRLEAVPGVRVVRRCVDVPDLVAYAASRQADVALVALPMPGLSADLVDRLGELGISVVGVHADRDDGDAAMLGRIGVEAVLTPAEMQQVPAVVQRLREDRVTDDGTRSAGLDDPVDLDAGLARGRVLAVWGPAGGPGRSTLALGLAQAMVRLRLVTVLIDADVYGGAQAQLLGLLDESSGLLAACRGANLGQLTADVLARHTVEATPGLRVLTGLPRADRWNEASPVLVRSVLSAARSMADTVVVDCGFSLERDEEVMYDTTTPRRNGATLEVLGGADSVLVVGSADPVGLGRLIRALEELRDSVPGVAPYVVVNRMRPTLGWDAEEVRELVRRSSGLDVQAVLPDDPAACDRAVAQGRGLLECAPDSRLARSLVRVASELAGVPAGQFGGRRLRRRTTARAR